MKMTSVKGAELEKKWYVVDAADQVVGRLASHIAYVLRGKHKTNFVPHLDCGDHVVVINAEKVKLTGNKLQDKVYHNHTGYIGGIKARKAGFVLESHPERILETAVKGMLPHTKLGAKQLKSLKVYAGSEHPHESQKPSPLLPRLNRK